MSIFAFWWLSLVIGVVVILPQQPVLGMYVTATKGGLLETTLASTFCSASLKVECVVSGGVADFRVLNCTNAACTSGCTEVDKSAVPLEFVACHFNPLDFWPRLSSSNNYAYFKYSESDCQGNITEAVLQWAPNVCLLRDTNVYQKESARCTPDLAAVNKTLLEYNSTSYNTADCSNAPYLTLTTPLFGTVVGICNNVSSGSVKYLCEPSENYVPSNPPLFTPGAIYPRKTPLAPFLEGANLIPTGSEATVLVFSIVQLFGLLSVLALVVG